MSIFHAQTNQINKYIYFSNEFNLLFQSQINPDYKSRIFF